MNNPIINEPKKKVTFIVAGMPHYREKFHQINKKILNNNHIEYELYISPPKVGDKSKGDQVNISWAKKIKDSRLRVNNHEIIWQRLPLSILKSDLIIIIQENSYLLNYLLSIGRFVFNYKLAYFGHGKNYQSKNRNNFSERWKRLWLKKCDWWFTYTDKSAENIIFQGYPKDKITVFNNSIDTSALKDNLNSISENEIEQIKSEFELNSNHICVFLGGLYEEKRLEFLIDASTIIRKEIPDFTLFICGDGPKYQKIKDLTDHLNWIKLTGTVFNTRKASILSISKLMLMPGLVGLVVLDSFAAGLPIITTNIDYHSPEIEYLKTAGAGLIIEPADDPEIYARAVINLLKDENSLNELKKKSLSASAFYSIENMSVIFCKGIQTVVNS
jgi:glycosyltransferase involved in cell wall biosynthesis